MDHIPSLPKSFKGNTELLIWTDLFTGLVIAKAASTRTAQQVACSYEECVFRQFGASEVIRHDREPGFMAEVFRSFNQMLGQKQSATMAYRRQMNGKAERMVQTLTRAIKMYVADSAQQDWDEYVERLVFALNSSFDRIRGDTPFYLAYGWDPDLLSSRRFLLDVPEVDIAKLVDGVWDSSVTTNMRGNKCSRSEQ